MTFARLPSQAPQFDAGAFAKHAGMTAADIKNFQAWGNESLQHVEMTA